MLKSERHKIIMDLIRQQQNVKATELKELLQVSDETVRRDLVELEKQGQLRCVHGGAVYDSFTSNEYNVDVRIRNNPLEKEAICREAAKLVQDGESLAIVASTTTLPLGKYLAEKNNLTVVTNSIPLTNQISANKSNTVILTGGKMWHDQQKMMGALTAFCFRQYRVDKAFFSVTGISPQKGITEYTEDETEVVRSVLSIGEKKILLNDATKFNITGFCKLADVTQVDAIVTDWHMTKRDMHPYEVLGLEVYYASKK